MTVNEHRWFTTRNVEGGWEWDCSCGRSGAAATEDAAAEQGYQHEGTDRAALLGEVEHLRAIKLAALEYCDNIGRPGSFAQFEQLDTLVREP